jgi:hypothetical protein
MTTEVRELWLRRQDEDLSRAFKNKQSHEALLSITARYRGLPVDDRAVVDELLAEQLSSEDETTRFIALALIQDFRIHSAVRALRQLAVWLEAQSWPGAPYEWAKVNRIIGRLTDPDTSEG